MKGTIHLRRRQIFTIFDPYPTTVGSFFTTSRRQIWPIFDPYPPLKKCRRLQWMVSKQLFQFPENECNVLVANKQKVWRSKF